MKWFVFLLLLPILLLVGGLLLNRPPLLAPPGPIERLRAYLTTNVAETRVHHVFPELRPRRFSVSAQVLQDAVLTAMRSLGWREIEPSNNAARAVVVSPLFRFRDDVSVRIEAQGGGALLQARSAARIGKGDLAANARHLQDLFAQVQRLIGQARTDAKSQRVP